METSLDDPFPTALFSMMADMPISFYLINGLVIVVLLCLSALFSGSEVAFFSLSHNQVVDINRSEDHKDKRMRILLHDPKRLLATILILNNLVNVFIITISTFASWQILGKQGNHIVILTTVITILIVFFGEIIPKIYANHNRVSFAKKASGLLLLSYKLFKPISWFLTSMTGLIERKMKKKGYNLSVEEIHQALEISIEKENVTKEEKGILKGVVNFGTISVKNIMKSRLDITAIDRETNWHELINLINKTGYSRIPIFTETIDKIDGVLYIKDVLPHLNDDDDFKWQELLRDIYFVPESKKIDDLFKYFQKKQVHIAMVIDEYTGTSGLITMEDLIEEIVGDIHDEFDDDSDSLYNELDSKTFVFKGKTPLIDFCKITNSDISIFDSVKGENESLGGLLLEVNASLPHLGEKISIAHFVFTVASVDQRHIKQIRVYINTDKDNVVQLE